MDHTTGNQNSTQQENSPLSQNDLGVIIAALHSYPGLDPDKVDALTKGVQLAAAPRPAEEKVEGWEPAPPLMSDEEFTFGAGSNTKTVKLKILGGDYYVSTLLPKFEEWATALYRGQALDMFKLAENDPITFMFDVMRTILKRPGHDRIKISFYETCAETFSTPEQEITAQFFAVCPPDQQIGSIRKLVATNRGNFTGAWAGMPLLLRHEFTLLYMTGIQSIQKLRETLTNAMSSMTTEIQQSLLNGGVENTGQEESSVLQAAMSETTLS